MENNEKYIVNKNGKIFSLHINKYLSTHKDKDGYELVCLYKNGVGKTHKVHRLIAEKFIKNPLNKKEVNHINGIKSDNRVENLQWCTAKENNKHARDTGLILPMRPENCFTAKLNVLDVLIIRKMIKRGKLNIRDIAKIFNVHNAQISRIKNRKTWKYAEL